MSVLPLASSDIKTRIKHLLNRVSASGESDEERNSFRNALSEGDVKSDDCSDGSLKTIKSGFDLVIGANFLKLLRVEP